MEWINIVKATTTRNKIKNFFSKNEKEVYMDRGKYTLEKELRKKKIAISDFSSEENLKALNEEFKLDSMDDIYLAIGNGKTSALSLINFLYKERRQHQTYFRQSQPYFYFRTAL